MNRNLLLIILMLLLINPASANWWDSNWLFKSDNAVSNGSRPYVLELNVSNSSGTNNNTHIFCNGNCNPSFSDVRFILDNNTQLPIWKNNDTNKIYVNVTSNGTVSFYYGNTGNTTDVSNGTRVFHRYADAKTLFGWTNFGATVDATKITIPSGKYITTDANVSRSAIAEYSVSRPADATTLFHGFTSNVSKPDYAGIGVFLYYAGDSNTYTVFNSPAQSVVNNGAYTSAVKNIKILWTNSSTTTKFYINGSALTSPASNFPTVEKMNFSIGQADGAPASTSATVYYAFVYHYDINQTSTSYETEATSYTNNYTNNVSLNFTVLKNTVVNFSYRGSVNSWFVNGVNQSNNFSYFNYSFTTATSTNITANTTYGNISWTVLSVIYPLELQTPANGSSTYSPVTFTWREWITSLPHTFYLYGDSEYLNLISSSMIVSGVNETFTTSVSGLTSGVTYWWRVKNSTGVYSSTFNFTVIPQVETPGQFNISVFEEQNWTTRIPSFMVQLYNATAVINKNTSTGWANFSSDEVSSGEYLIRIVPNSSYSTRSVLSTSPANVSMWIPRTTSTIDVIAFYLLDYTNKYSWDTTTLAITKNGSTMHKAYFDADAKVSVNIIRDDSYGVTITNGMNIHNWGNYISTSSGNVEVVVLDIGVNTTLRNPLVFNVTKDGNEITLRWQDSGSYMLSINYTVMKSKSKVTVHNIITSLKVGASTYIVTNTSDIYYVTVSALTSTGYRNQSYVFDYRSQSDAEGEILHTWTYGSASIPSWVKNIVAIILLAMMAGTAGAMHRGEGGIITAICALVFWKWGWIYGSTALGGFLGGLLLFAVLYHLDSKRKGY